MSAKVGERGQVTIPKELRDRFGMGPNAEVEFVVMNGNIVLRKAPAVLNFEKWKSRGEARLSELGYESADDYIEDIRGR